MNTLTYEKIIELDKKTNVIPLTSDTMGKNIFKKNIELTKVFIKDILNLEEEINDIEFIDTEMEVETPKNYKFITDLVILVNNNLIVNIELCRDYYNKHKERLLAYIYKLAVLDIKKGQNVENQIKKVKQIVFANKEKNVEYAGCHFKLYDEKRKKLLTNSIEVQVHYLEKHYKNYYNNTEVTKEDLWFSLFMSNSLVEQNKILKILVSDEIRNKFIRSVYNMSNDSKMKIDFDAENYNNYVHEEKIKDAEIMGINRGFEQGIERGIEQGKREIALELIKMNMETQDISKITGLSIEKIKEIEKNK